MAWKWTILQILVAVALMLERVPFRVLPQANPPLVRARPRLGEDLERTSHRPNRNWLVLFLLYPTQQTVLLAKEACNEVYGELKKKGKPNSKLDKIQETSNKMQLWLALLSCLRPRPKASSMVLVGHLPIPPTTE